MRRALLALALLAAGPLGAQGFQLVPRTQPEARLDASMARRGSAVVMVGANTALGYYVRAGGAVGAGVADAGRSAVFATRADLTLRFLLDPFAEHRWGPYAGGGLTVRRDGSARANAGLLVLLGVEARAARRWTPALEVGLGEGVRVAVALRKSRSNGR